MSEKIIENWNQVVEHDDIVFHVGDVSWKDYILTKMVLDRLNGIKFLAIGNHDFHMKKLDGYFEQMRKSYLIKVANQLIFLSHQLTDNWPEAENGSWHLFGHSHGKRNNYAETNGKLLDVGVDSHDFRPWSLEEVAQVMATRPLNFNDLRRRRFK
ncbi:MAG: hypothetical protein Q8P20_01570 [bacterium]|nr:hypothetical protein [bacterium]